MLKPKLTSILIYVPMLLLLGGCSHLNEWLTTGKVGPDYFRPAAAFSPEWQNCNGPHIIAQQNAVENHCWWRSFGDAEIDKMVATANSQYLPLRAAALRVQEQFFLRNIAVGNLAPQRQEFFSEYQRIQFGNNGNQFGIQGFGNSFDLFQYGFNASWEIDLWGRLKRLVESSDAKLQATIEDEYDIRLSLTSEVVAAYIEIRVLQQRLLIAREQIAAQSETLRIAEARFKNGSTSKLDATQATALVESTRATIAPLQSKLRQTNNRLCLLLGIPCRVLFDENNTGPIPFGPDSVAVGMPRDLLRRRPDIRRAEREIAAQSALIGAAAAELFPALTLRGTLNWQAFDIADLFESGSTSGAIVPGVKWNILNYGRLMNNVHVQKTRLWQAITKYEQTVLSANTEVENAMTDFVKRKEEIACLDKAIRAIRESLTLANVQYREGDIDFDRVNELRKDLVKQLDLHAALRGQTALALIRIYKTMGGGWNTGCSQAPMMCPQTQPFPVCGVMTAPQGNTRLQVPANEPYFVGPQPNGPMPNVPMPNGPMPNGPMPNVPMPVGPMPVGPMQVGPIEPIGHLPPGDSILQNVPEIGSHYDSLWY